MYSAVDTKPSTFEQNETASEFTYRADREDSMPIAGRVAARCELILIEMMVTSMKDLSSCHEQLLMLTEQREKCPVSKGKFHFRVLRRSFTLTDFHSWRMVEVV